MVDLGRTAAGGTGQSSGSVKSTEASFRELTSVLGSPGKYPAFYRFDVSELETALVFHCGDKFRIRFARAAVAGMPIRECPNLGPFTWPPDEGLFVDDLLEAVRTIKEQYGLDPKE